MLNPKNNQTPIMSVFRAPSPLLSCTVATNQRGYLHTLPFLTAPFFFGWDSDLFDILNEGVGLDPCTKLRFKILEGKPNKERRTLKL